jgi:hypothetical protein
MDYSATKSIIDEARQLHRSGQSEFAIQKLIVPAEVGSIDAMIELAHIARDQDRKSDSDKWIDEAEATLKPGDLDGHISLNGAYSLGLGRGEREILERRALHHLELVALAGNTTAQEGLALHFLHGMDGCERDVNKFEYWIGLAINAGSSRAAYIYAEYLYKEARQVPLDIVEKLEAVRGHNKAAEKLLNAMAKRAKG